MEPLRVQPIENRHFESHGSCMPAVEVEGRLKSVALGRLLNKRWSSAKGQFFISYLFYSWLISKEKISHNHDISCIIQKLRVFSFTWEKINDKDIHYVLKKLKENNA